MKKFILTALFLFVMASFLLESPSQTRLQEDNPALPKPNDWNPLLAGEAGNLKMFPAGNSYKKKAGCNALFVDTPGKVEAQKTSQIAEPSFINRDDPTVKPKDPN